MLIKINKIEYLLKPFLFLALSFYLKPVFSQNNVRQDTILRIPKGSLIQNSGIKSFTSTDTLIKIPYTLLPSGASRGKQTLTFYDSLKSIASKTLITKAIFDLVIVTHDTTNKKSISSKSDAGFIDFSGKRIRKIFIQRLNAFGASIDNPGYYNPHGVEKLFNSTHINTNESIIKKYLLFNEGDTISPLQLSDNERIIRQLPYIDDARIIVVPVSGTEADLIVVTKDVYSLGGNFLYKGRNKGSLFFFERNIFGMGHEFELEVPYSSKSADSPGIGLKYKVKNIRRSFIDLNFNYYNGLGKKTYGINISRDLVSSSTKYAGGLSVVEMFTSVDLDTLLIPQPFEYNFQDYWLLRSFLLDRESVSRIIIGARYINNNVFERPFINPNSYHSLQNYRFFLGSVCYSIQKYYKTNLIYSYGRTEDVPYGGLFRLTSGLERNEFKKRSYYEAELSFGGSAKQLGYLYSSAGFGTFLNGKNIEQGSLILKMKYFSNLVSVGKYRIRNFVNIDYVRGINRYYDEYINLSKDNGFTGFTNDSLMGIQKATLGLESVIFSPVNLIGFRFAFFGFADLAFIAGTDKILNKENILSGAGLGIRIRNDNLIFNTFQIRLGFFPNPPAYSRINNLTVSGEQLLHPYNFDPVPPEVIPYR